MSIMKKRPNPDKVDTLIGNKTVFEGKLNVYGGIRIDGAVKGEIECQGILVVGNGGKIEANIIADSAIIGGEVIGNITAKNRLEIISKGKVRGDIASSHLIINDGVIFDGSCHMLSDKPVKYPLDKKEDIPAENSLQENEKQ
ncbi:MAG: polymer-forming cytoskeletal protein [Deltaproteobacteria bacterium]|nr:polymer-forming cytoskeletal protein [Deltaproteobacteria bacterium]